MLLTSTADIVGGERNTDKSSIAEVKSGDKWGTEAVKHVLGGRTPGMDEGRPEFLTAMDIVGLS